MTTMRVMTVFFCVAPLVAFALARKGRGLSDDRYLRVAGWLVGIWLAQVAGLLFTGLLFNFWIDYTDYGFIYDFIYDHGAELSLVLGAVVGIGFIAIHTSFIRQGKLRQAMLMIKVGCLTWMVVLPALLFVTLWALYTFQE